MPADELTPLNLPTTEVFPPPAPSQIEVTRAIAPLWHTGLLIAAILCISFFGAGRMDSAAAKSDPHRLAHYALSAVMELLLVGFVYLGVRLRRIPFRSLLGTLPQGLNDITKEAGIALLFWIVSMAVLGSVAITWNLVQTAIYHLHQKQSLPQTAKEQSPQQEQIEMAKKLMQLAPANGVEIAAWGTLCVIVGIAEETLFRGYLQAQSIHFLRSTLAGLLFSALIFGAAHGYQGVRGMCLITVYGALFGGIALIRRNLLPGMLAHSWHDFATGMLLALIRESHLLEHLPKT